MTFRLFSLPPGLRHAIFAPCRASPPAYTTASWPRPAHRSFSSQFFTRTAAPAPSLRHKLLVLLPLAGGILFCAAPQSHEDKTNIFASDKLIPCPAASQALLEPTILSPAEPEDQRIIWRIVVLVREYVLEPMHTARRFVYLCFLFVPVLLAAPMLLVGAPEERLSGDRWGAVWWYGFLTAQMQRAGPTFVKVSSQFLHERLLLYVCHAAFLCPGLRALR